MNPSKRYMVPDWLARVSPGVVVLSWASSTEGYRKSTMVPLKGKIILQLRDRAVKAK